MEAEAEAEAVEAALKSTASTTLVETMKRVICDHIMSIVNKREGNETQVENKERK